MTEEGGWNTIESDAGVFTYLIEELGVKDVQFEELLSLDAESIHELSPVYGVIFLFKYVGEKPSATPRDGSFDAAASENMFFAAQTIQNACGTQALLSVLLNKDHEEVELGQTLTDFKDFTQGIPSDLRGEALSNSPPIRETHNSFARASPFTLDPSLRPPADPHDSDLYHFIAYLPLHNTLYELDGLQPHPISHGPLSPPPAASDPSSTRDWYSRQFAEQVVEVIRRRIGRYGESEIRFNLLACCRDLRLRAQETGDVALLDRERAKRRNWAWENALRRHNFVGLIGEVAKGVATEKVKDGSWKEWVRGAQTRAEDRRKKGRGGDEMDVGE
ncbi:MAG: hypothetical protein M1821_008251 [Bathelium mastoideum]|nr:MAG: hypothetical protein M1821_008251 [Bathelium mastoideum]